MKAWHIAKSTGSEFAEDNVMMLSAALAFYSALSLAPLLVLLLWASSFLGPDTQDQFVNQVRSFMGSQASEGVQMVIQNAKDRPDVRNIAGIIGLVTLLFSAAGVFAQLQKAMNIIWDVKPKPGQGIGGWIRKRLLSLSMVVTIGFLLLISLAVSTALSAMVGRMEQALPGGNYVWQAVDFIISLAVYTLLFAAVFKYLPDVHVEWREVWTGAMVTAILFAIGKVAIGIYLGQSSVGSAYGAAGSLVVMLVWVYYSAIILFFGAELTQVASKQYGHEIIPDRHAIWADRKPHAHAGPQPA